MAFNQKNPPWQRNAGHQNIPGMQAIVSFPQAQPVYNPNIGLQQQQNISILPQIGMQQQQALYSQTVQYPTNRPINAIGFPNQQQSQPPQSPITQNSSKFNPNNRVFSGTGQVTKLQNDFGFIDDEVFFHMNTCVKGVIPEVGDRVLVDAAYNSNMPFKWNASRVQVLQSSTSSSSGHMNSSQVRSHASMYNTSSNQPDSRSSNARNRYSPPPRKSPERQMHRSSNSRSKDDYDDSERRRKRDDRDRDRDSDRSATYREKHHEARSSERGRERERSPIRKPSPKRRRVRSVPRYMVQVPKHLLTIKQADLLELRRRYSNLYIPSDFFVSDIRWTEAFPPDAPFSIRSPCHFHVMHKDVEPPGQMAGSGESGLDPPDADYLYSAKVMLMSTPPLAEFYDKCNPKGGADDRYDEERDYMHPTRLISFLVGMRGKNETMAIGGPWSPSLDGADPQSDPTVLIRTAVRTCRALTGIDLSSCSQWYRFVELYYRRSESYHKGRLIPPRVETVVIFLPDVRSCQPTRLEWEQLRLSYKASLARVLNCSSSSSNSNNSSVGEAPTNADPSPAVAQATPISRSTDDVTTIAADSGAASVVGESSVVAPVQTESQEAVAVAESTADAGAVSSQVADGTAAVAQSASSHATAAVAAGAVSAEKDGVALATQPDSESNTIGSSASAAPAAASAVAAAVAETTPAASIMDTTEGGLPAVNQSAAELLLEYKKMKVADLKAELNSRNLPTDGIKAVLLSRLSEAVLKEHRQMQLKAQAEQLSELKQKPEPAELKEKEPSPVQPKNESEVAMETDAPAENDAAMEIDAEKSQAAPKTEIQEIKETMETMETKETKETKETTETTETKETKETKEIKEIKEEKEVENSTLKVAPNASEGKLGGTVPKAPLVAIGEGGGEVATKPETKPTVVARKKEEPVKLSEKERQALERRYQLPEKPHILVHPSRVAKSGKFDCSVMSLSLLLDYRPEDTKEHSFEVALFSELFNEMITRDFGFNIYRALHALPQAKKEADESKKDGSVDGGGKAASETGGGISNGEEGGKTSASTVEKGDESRKKASHADEKEQRDRKRVRHSETTDEERKSRDKDSGKGLVVNADLLLSFVYFDVTHCGYMVEKDVEDLIYTLGLNLSRSQIRKTMAKGTVRDPLHYRKLIERVLAVPAPTPQPEETVAPIEGAVDAEKPSPVSTEESSSALPCKNTKEAVETMIEPQPEKEMLVRVARGNTDYKLQLKASLKQILTEQNGEFDSNKAEKNTVAEISATKTGIVEYNGCVVDIGKLLEQVKRTESAREETEKLLVNLQGQHAKLLTSNTRATSKIKDLQTENKTLNKQLSEATRVSREAVQMQTEYYGVIQHVYERVRPIVHKPNRDGSSSGGSSKRESSKEKSSRTSVPKSKEKDAAVRKEDDKGAREKNDGSHSKAGPDDASGDNNVTTAGDEQESPEQTTPSAMETDAPNSAEKCANDGEQTS